MSTAISEIFALLSIHQSGLFASISRPLSPANPKLPSAFNKMFDLVVGFALQ
jgi:hypothetical protein